MFQQFFSKNTVESIDAQTAWKRLSASESARLVDVREPWEYKGGHARGAINIPLSQIQQKITEFPADREVLLICQSGHRSMQAARFLQQHGIQRVVNVTGGTSLWRVHNLPME